MSTETNYTLGMLELSARLRRRSLIVVFTEFVDSVTAALMYDNLDRLARRHVVLFVALRDPSIDGIEQAPLSSMRDLNRAVVAAGLQRERDVVLERLKRTGVHVVDAAPEQVSMSLINSYLDIKRRELV